MSHLSIANFTLTSALGVGKAAHQLTRGLETLPSGLQPNQFRRTAEEYDLQTWLGEVKGLDELAFPERLSEYDCRNNRLAWLALQQDEFMQTVAQRKQQYGADRIGVVLGTSTSGILQTELAYQTMHEQQATELPEWFNYETTHHTGSCAHFVSDALGLHGFTMVVSTACSSSAKVFANAERLLRSGVCDAVIVGGVDSLCYTTLFGFNALQLVSKAICRPGDVRRDGLSIGEAGGFALVELTDEPSSVVVAGVGESQDAYHMSTPHPEGEGARLAMQRALDDADLSADSIDYVNLHGTATPANDAAEDKAVCAVFGQQTPVSSTKGWAGHALGAAGILEIGFTILALQSGELPPSLNMTQPDPALQANVLQTVQEVTSDIRRGLSNSFGFGGSNCSVIVECRAEFLV